MDNQPIGIIDSGVGGLSIWKEIVSQLPLESTIYIADSKNCPYGIKSESEVCKLSPRLVQFLIDSKVKLVVIACNTISVYCVDKLRKKFPSVPIVGVVPVVKTAAEHSKNRKIGILATTSTVKSDYEKKLIQTFAKGCEVISLGTKKLVPFVEQGDVSSKRLQKIIKKELQIFIEKKIYTLVLGCSHFPFLRDTIQKIVGPQVEILDSAGAIARQVRRVLTNNNLLSEKNSSKHQFFTTGDAEQFKKVAKKLIGDTVTENIEHVRL